MKTKRLISIIAMALMLLMLLSSCDIIAPPNVNDKPPVDDPVDPPVDPDKKNDPPVDPPVNPPVNPPVDPPVDPPKPVFVPGTTTVNIMTFNICGIESKTSQKDTMTVLNTYKPDIINFQESESQSCRKYLKENIDKTVYGDASGAETFGSAYNNFYKYNQGSADLIFYNKQKYDRIDAGYYWLTTTPEEESKIAKAKHYRTMTWLVLEDKVTGNRFMVINTHIDNGEGESDGDIYTVRKLQCQLLLFLVNVKLEKYSSLPKVLTGDFNMRFNNSNDSFKILSESDLFIWAKDIAEDTAYTGERPILSYGKNLDYTFIFEGYSERPSPLATDQQVLDYIMVSRNMGIKVNKYSVIYHNSAYKEGYYRFASDHMPLVSEFVLPAQLTAE